LQLSETIQREPLRITPEPGMLVIFPLGSNIWCIRITDRKNRISIAINIKLIDFDG